MIEQSVSAFGAKEKVQVLLQEYSTLRTEILFRTNQQFQLVAAGAVLLVWLSSRPIDTRFWVVLGIALAVLLTFGWMPARAVRKAARRIRQIEAYVNAQAGEELLEWETRWGSAVTGYLGLAPSKAPAATMSNQTDSMSAEREHRVGGS